MTTVTFSNRGKKKLVCDGYIYAHNKQWVAANEERHLWNCEWRQSLGCKATITANVAGAVIRTSAVGHNHLRSENRAEALTALHRIRRDAKERPEAGPAAILNERVQLHLVPALPSAGLWMWNAGMWTVERESRFQSALRALYRSQFHILAPLATLNDR